MRIYGNAYGEEVAGASRARPLRRRLASRMRTPGKTPGQQTGARRFSHVFTNHDARQHNVITFTPPTKPMIAESGFYTNVKGNKFPRLQILTIEDLHSGKVRAEHPDYEPDLILPRVKICGTVFWRKNGVKIFGEHTRPRVLSLAPPPKTGVSGHSTPVSGEGAGNHMRGRMCSP